MKKYFLHIFVLVFVSLPLVSKANTAFIEVDTKGERVNAIEGTLVLPKSFDLERVETGQSSILIWITQPKFDASSREIVFAGLTPGGFSGGHPIFSLIGDFAEADLKNIVFKSIKGLRDDGEGTEVKVSMSIRESLNVIDTLPPEPFVVVVSKDEELFANKFFASFQANDKGTGILKYEVSEKWFLSPKDEGWQEALSPYEIKDKWNLKKLYIKALDHEGNSREVSTSLPNRKYAIMFFVIIILVLCIFLTRRLRRHFSSLG